MLPASVVKSSAPSITGDPLIKPDPTTMPSAAVSPPTNVPISRNVPGSRRRSMRPRARAAILEGVERPLPVGGLRHWHVLTRRPPLTEVLTVAAARGARPAAGCAAARLLPLRQPTLTLPNRLL